MHRLSKNRNVQTLLLCKVNPSAVRYQTEKSYQDYYQRIPALNSSKNSRFITFGNFDAAAIYNTPDTDGPDWLAKIDEDRRSISAQLDVKMHYHPIHMVTYDFDPDFWHKTAHFPAVVFTLVYGVSPKEGRSCDNVIRKYLSDPSLQIDNSRAQFAVYQAVNICDAVVIWMTNDIPYVLELTSGIMRNAAARKTYSLPGLATGSISNLNDFRDRLAKQLYATSEKVGNFSLRFQGSIREHALVRELFLAKDSDIRKWVGSKCESDSAIIQTRIYGNEDFVVSLSSLTKDQFISLVVHMIQSSVKISNACWEIHAEFAEPDSPEDCELHYRTDKSIYPHPLDDKLERFNLIYNRIKEPSPGSYPWAAVFHELLATQVNIDHHPILHAPASLFSEFIDISLYFFDRATNPDDPEQRVYQGILRKSRDDIEGILRHWSRLTDKLIRIDDLVFHGIGSVPAIHETLPESVLEFYHSYLRDVVDTIQGSDQEYRAPGQKYQYDFLLVPELNMRPRISQMFNQRQLHTEVLKSSDSCPHAESSCIGKDACKNICPRRLRWPIKQVHLVEFGTELLYNPAGFLFPLVHECFHVYGQQYRLRERRFAYFEGLMATEIQNALDLDRSWFQPFGRKLREAIHVQKTAGLDLHDTKDILYNQIKKLFASSWIDELKKDTANFYYLNGDYFATQWSQLRDSFSPDIPGHVDYWGLRIRDWAYYFKECYADLMALLFLEFDIDQYFILMSKEWGDSGSRTLENHPDSAWKYIQRAALVIGAYYFDKNTRYRKEEIKAKMQAFADAHADKTDFFSQCYEKIAAVLIALYVTGEELSLEPGQKHPTKLLYVRNYLHDVKKNFSSSLAASRPALEKLRKNYKYYFCDGMFFTDAYAAYLRSHNPSFADLDDLEA